jgi:hypothetical protein
MFVRDEVLLDLEFAAAQARVTGLARGGRLQQASKEAYAAGSAYLTRAGPQASVSAMSRLVETRYRDLIADSGSARLTLRWLAAAPDGALFAALDADITLTPSGDEVTVLVLDGVYRLPPGSLDDGLDVAVIRRVVPATVRAFVGRLADALTRPAPDAGWRRRTTGHDMLGLPPVAEMP